MTSKISSFKLLKESIRGNIALGVLILVGFFCYFPLVGSLLLRSLGRAAVSDIEQLNTLWAFGSANPVLFVVTFGLALLLGLLQFSYLHSPRKLDLYHSISVRRERLFAVQYLAGVLLWLLPFMAGSFLYWILCEMSGFGSGLAPLLLRGLLAHGACFLLVYSLTVLTMMLTGKIFAAVCGIIVFCGYFPFVKMVQEMLMEYYFATYYFGLGQDSDISIFYRSTPIYAFTKVCQDLMSDQFPQDLLLALALISLLLIAFSLWLYRIRGSERAGNSMAFPAVARIVKFLLVVPTVLLISTALNALAEMSFFWGLIGWVLGLLLASGFMEFLYCLDIREIFQDWKQLIFTGLVTLAILVVFQFDLLGHDRWLPEPSQVESVSLVDVSNFIDIQFVNEYEECSRSQDGQKVQYAMRSRKEADSGYTFSQDQLEEAYALIRHSTVFTGEQTKEMYDGSTWYVRGTMTFRMKDGREKYRSYVYSEEAFTTWFAPIWDSEEYKEARYPLLQVQPEQVIDVIAAGNNWLFDSVIVEEDLSAKKEEPLLPAGDEEAQEIAESRDLEYAEFTSRSGEEQGEVRAQRPLTLAQKKEILETLQKDLSGEKLAVFPEYDYVLNIVYHGTDGKVYGEECCLNADFQDTLDVLRACGFDLPGNQPKE